MAQALAAEGLPLPVPLDAVLRGDRPMPLALDTGTAWKVWAAACGARPAAGALKPPPPVAPAPTPLVLGDVFQRVTTRRHTVRLVQVWARQPAGAALIETERAAVLADVRAELKRQGLGCPPRTEAAIRAKLGDLLLGIERRTV